MATQHITSTPTLNEALSLMGKRVTPIRDIGNEEVIFHKIDDIGVVTGFVFREDDVGILVTWNFSYEDEIHMDNEDLPLLKIL